MAYLIAFLAGTISSLVSALVFLVFLSKVRPKLSISDDIAKFERSNDKDHRIRYMIKVVNDRRRSIINIKARLDMITRVNVPGGVINNRREIPLKIDSVFEISAYSPRSHTETYTWRFITYEDLDETWKDDELEFVRFQIYGTDSFSNFAVVYTKDYFTKKSIKLGDFEYGVSLKVQ